MERIRVLPRTVQPVNNNNTNLQVYHPNYENEETNQGEVDDDDMEENRTVIIFLHDDTETIVEEPRADGEEVVEAVVVDQPEVLAPAVAHNPPGVRRGRRPRCEFCDTLGHYANQCNSPNLVILHRRILDKFKYDKKHEIIIGTAYHSGYNYIYRIITGPELKALAYYNQILFVQARPTLRAYRERLYEWYKQLAVTSLENDQEVIRARRDEEIRIATRQITRSMERHLQWISGDNLIEHVMIMTEYLQMALGGDMSGLGYINNRPYYNRPRQLLRRNHFNIAFNLINRDTEQKEAEETEFRCPICLEDKDICDSGMKPDCGHMHCNHCVDMYLISRQNQPVNEHDAEQNHILRCSMCRSRITKIEMYNTNIHTFMTNQYL